MLELIKIHLEKCLKEYTELNIFFRNSSTKEKVDKIKSEIALEVQNLGEDANIADIYFEKLGWLSAMENDEYALKARLFHTYEAYKNLVEIPQEIKEQIEKELENFKMRLTYDVKGGEKTIVDQELYEMFKAQFSGVLKNNLT